MRAGSMRGGADSVEFEAGPSPGFKRSSILDAALGENGRHSMTPATGAARSKPPGMAAELKRELAAFSQNFMLDLQTGIRHSLEDKFEKQYALASQSENATRELTEKICILIGCIQAQGFTEDMRRNIVTLLTSEKRSCDFSEVIPQSGAAQHVFGNTSWVPLRSPEPPPIPVDLANRNCVDNLIAVLDKNGAQRFRETSDKEVAQQLTSIPNAPCASLELERAEGAERDIRYRSSSDVQILELPRELPSKEEDLDGYILADLELTVPWKNWSNLVLNFFASSHFKDQDVWMMHMMRQKSFMQKEVQSLILDLRETWKTGTCGAAKIRPSQSSFLNKVRGVNLAPEDALSFNRSHSRHSYHGAAIHSKSCVQPLIHHPDGKFVIVKALMSACLLFYDVITLPLVVFDNESSDWSTMMAWVTTSFWTMDLWFSFTQGYHNKGVIEMRPQRVACHYFATWFIIDFFISTIDWFTLISTSISEEAQGNLKGGISSQISSTFRVLRVLRCLRLLRVVKLVRYLGRFIDSMASEIMLLVMRLLAAVCSILFINHYFACCWYGIAVHWSGRYSTNWIEAKGLWGAEKSVLYLTSFHWSVTQFTPATNNIGPTNPPERAFSVFVVIFALISFSNFLSSLTNASMQIRTINAFRTNEESQIREFLSRKKVPLHMANRLWEYFRGYYRTRKRFTQESDIPFFLELPASMVASLHSWIYIPVITEHPLFLRQHDLDGRSVLEVCRVAISERSFQRGQEIFQQGDVADYMYFMSSGTLEYDCVLYNAPLLVEPPYFISEATVWSFWTHCGVLKVRNQCEILMLNALLFEDTMHKMLDDTQLRSLKRYAVLYTQKVSDAATSPEPMTDMPSRNRETAAAFLEELAVRTFGRLVDTAAPAADTSVSALDWSSRATVHTRAALSRSRDMISNLGKTK